MANPNEWSQFYNHQTLFTTVTTTTTTVDAAANPPAPASMAISLGDSRLNPDGGRVSKPARRRSRASRRMPTTLLNTDSTNFRAMVQQFTGGPSAMAFGSVSELSLTSSLNPSACGLNQQSPGQFQYNQEAQARPYMLSMSNVNALGHNLSPNHNVVGGVTTAVYDGFGTAEEGGRGGSALSQVLSSTNTTTSWLQ